MLKRKNKKALPEQLEDSLYPDDYWLDKEDGQEVSEPLPDGENPVSGKLRKEPMVTGYEALERQRGVRRPKRKITRREKKALKQAQKYEAKLRKEQERADKKSEKREAKLAEKAEKEAMLYNTQLVISPVPLSESKFKEIKTDPVAIQSIWRGGNYLNLILQVKVKDQKHGYHFIENKLENKDGEQTLYLTLYHDRNNDIEGFNRKVYLSVPLWAYAGKLHKGDKIVFNIRTYKEGMTSRIFYF